VVATKTKMDKKGGQWKQIAKKKEEAMVEKKLHL
jgi:hypothetical protein